MSSDLTDFHGDGLPYFEEPSKALDSSLKRHTALIKRIRQSIGLDNRDQILKDIETLTLEKYIEEIAGAVPDGIMRCKFEKDVWSAAEVSHLDGY
jgi:regulator of nonsense transcripts 2